MALNSTTSTEKFIYNGLNQLVNYENTNGNYNGKVGLSAQYEYMANGYRVSKTVNDVETRYLWDKDNIVADMNGSNVISNNYYRGVNLVCDDLNKYYMHDAHGNVIEIYGKSADEPYNWYRYNAFGTNKYFGDSDILYSGQPWGYCDQYYDWETKNYYMRARYYNPVSGRFISEDTHWNPSNMIYGDKTYKEDETKYPDITASLQSSNLYGYCMGNPVKYNDIYGEKTYVTGIAGEIGAPLIISGTIAKVYDDFGNKGYLIAPSVGAGAGIGLGPSYGEYDVDTIYDLRGTTADGSVAGFSINLEKPDDGMAYSFGLEIKITVTKTFVISKDALVKAIKSKIKNVVDFIF